MRNISTWLGNITEWSPSRCWRECFAQLKSTSILKQMPIPIPCSVVEPMWTGTPELAIELGQQIGEVGDGNWWAGRHVEEIGKLELSGPAGDDQNDCHSVLSDYVKHSRQER